MTASEDAEQPDTVVLLVKGHFPTSETDYDGVWPTSELTGTLSFERAALELTEPAGTAPAR